MGRRGASDAPALCPDRPTTDRPGGSPCDKRTPRSGHARPPPGQTVRPSISVTGAPSKSVLTLTRASFPSMTLLGQRLSFPEPYSDRASHQRLNGLLTTAEALSFVPARDIRFRGEAVQICVIRCTIPTWSPVALHVSSWWALRASLACSCRAGSLWRRLAGGPPAPCSRAFPDEESLSLMPCRSDNPRCMSRRLCVRRRGVAPGPSAGVPTGGGPRV